MSKRISNLRETCHGLIVLAITVVVIIWLSIFCYGTFYYFYIPPVSHIKPVYLQFDTSCLSGICSFPSANVSLVQKGHDQLLSRGQLYKIFLDLEMPESAKNRQLGMFMVKLSLFTQDGLLLKSSYRTGLLHYKSNLLRYLSTLVFSPFLLTGSWEEKQTVTVLLFDNYIDHPDFPAYMASVELHSRTIEVYSAALRIHAHFSGLRYYMYYWPVFSALVGICTNFYFLTLLALLSWYRILQWQRDIDYEEGYLVESSSVALDSSSVEPPFSPLPVNLESSGSSETSKESPDSTTEGTEWKKSKEDLSHRSHSSVQELSVRRRHQKIPSVERGAIHEEETSDLQGHQTLQERGQSESF